MPRVNGTKGNDLLNGTTGDDEILLGLGSDTVYAGDGNDAIYARDTSMLSSDNDGNDTAYGEGGNDTLFGGEGNDYLDGGLGNDSLYGGNDNDTLLGGEGSDYIDASDGNDSIAGGAGGDKLYGVDGNDTLIGGDGSDYLSGGDGDDLLDGGDGDDSLSGGNGIDTMYGGAGDDSLYSRTTDMPTGSDDGANHFDGGAGNDSIYGGNGNDTIIGGDGNDQLDGGEGNNSIDGDNGSDVLNGGKGNDLLAGGAGNDELRDQSSGNDTLLGGAGDDKLSTYLSSGDDSLDGGEGRDTLYGGNGNDTLLGGDGNDYIDGSSGNDLLIGGGGDDELFGLSGNDSIAAGDGNDYLSGDEGDDSLSGGAGNDSLYGGTGNDTLDGGTGENTLNGGDGNDYYVIGNKTAYVLDSGGMDTALVIASFVKIPSTIESVVFAAGVQALPYWVDALLPDDAAGLLYATLLGASKTFNYTFPAVLPSFDTEPRDSDGFLAFNSQQKAFAGLAFSYIASVLDVAFVETSNPGAVNTISLANNSQTKTDGYARNPSTSFVGSDVFLAKASPSNNLSPVDGAASAQTLIHELGHVLGLKHPFANVNTAGNADEPPFLPASENDTLWTQMSYTDHSAQFHLVYSPLDIAALQYIYGPSRTARTGNDTYKVDQTTSNFIWDGAGTDTLDASSQTQPVTLYLEPGYWGYVGSKASMITSAGQVTVNFGSVIENLTGGSGDDSLFGSDIGNSISGGAGNDSISGNEGNDTLSGGDGNDKLDGGIGVDTAVYAGSRATYTLTTSGGITTIQAKTGTDGTDTLTNTERFQFSDMKIAINMGVTQSGGEAALLIGAVFGKTSLVDKSLVGQVLAFFDSGATMRDAATTLVNAGIIDNFAGGSSTSAFVNLIYKAVIGQPPTVADTKTLAALIDGGTYTKASFLTFVAEHPVNQVNVGLVGLQQTGIEYS